MEHIQIKLTCNRTNKFDNSERAKPLVLELGSTRMWPRNIFAAKPNPIINRVIDIIISLKLIYETAQQANSHQRFARTYSFFKEILDSGQQSFDLESALRPCAAPTMPASRSHSSMFYVMDKEQIHKCLTSKHNVLQIHIVAIFQPSHPEFRKCCHISSSTQIAHSVGPWDCEWYAVSILCLTFSNKRTLHTSFQKWQLWWE